MDGASGPVPRSRGGRGVSGRPVRTLLTKGIKPRDRGTGPDAPTLPDPVRRGPARDASLR